MTSAQAIALSGVGLLIVGGVVLAIGVNLYEKNDYDSKRIGGVLIKIASMMGIAAVIAFIKAAINFLS